jgi:uncharacterized protein (TIGR03435 family)
MRRTILSGAAVAALACTTSITGFAQTAKPPAFEVASIRLTEPRTPVSQKVTPGRVSLVNQQLWSLVLMAFNVREFQLSAPAWLRQVRVDIQATMPSDAPPERWREMLQTLLRDRFALVTHIESRPVEVNELTVGDNGIKMREVDPVDELAKEFPDALASPAVQDTLDGPVRTMGVLPPGTRVVTARTRHERFFTERGTTVIEASRMTMTELASVLASNLDQPVLDRTGLAGLYQFTVELPRDQTAVRTLLSAGITTTVQGTPLTEPTGVSTFKAVETLGLRLERRRLPFDIIVVDKIEPRPSDN